MTEFPFTRGFPDPEAIDQASRQGDLSRATEAYRFFYPSVSMEGLMQGSREVGAVDNEAFIILDCGPRHVMFTPNSDTPYGATFFDLSDGPWVIELPPGPYLGLVDDHDHRWVLDLGLPGPDAGKGGKHLIVPTSYEEDLPDGYFVGRCPTTKAFCAIRAIPLDGDHDKALESLRAIKAYPLAEASDPRPYRFVDVTDSAMGAPILGWEENFGFWDTLNDLVQAERPNPEFRVMYGLLAQLGIAKGQPFAPDEERRALLEQAAKIGRAEMLVAAFASRRDDRVAWSDRRWEWVGLVPENGDFEVEYGVDAEARDRWFGQAIVASPAMFRRKVGFGSLYWLAAKDESGVWLDGGHSYRLQVPLPVPAQLFWSVTAYDTETRSEVVTDLDNAALRSLTDNLSSDGDDAADLYFGPKPPPSGSSNWVQTVPGRGWFAYFRVYGPGEPAFNGTWRPGDFQLQK